MKPTGKNGHHSEIEQVCRDYDCTIQEMVFVLFCRSMGSHDIIPSSNLLVLQAPTCKDQPEDWGIGVASIVTVWVKDVPKLVLQDDSMKNNSGENSFFQLFAHTEQKTWKVASNRPASDSGRWRWLWPAGKGWPAQLRRRHLGRAALMSWKSAWMPCTVGSKIIQPPTRIAMIEAFFEFLQRWVQLGEIKDL